MLRKITVALVGPVMGLAMMSNAAPATAAPASDTSVTSAKVAKKSTMDCNGVTFAHNGWSYGWGNNRNRVIYGTGSAGNIRAVKVFGDGIASATWTIGVISQSGATVASSGTGPTYCVQVPSTTKGVDLWSRYPSGATAHQRIIF